MTTKSAPSAKLLTLAALLLAGLAVAAAPAKAEPQFGSGFLPHRTMIGPVQAAEGELPLQRVIAIAERAGSGEYLNANRDRGSVYRVKVIRSDGVVVHVFVDARTGDVLGVRDR